MLIPFYPNLRATIFWGFVLSGSTTYSQGLTFSPATYYSKGFSGSIPHHVAVKDINADGRADIFLSVGAAPRLNNQYLTLLQSVAGGFAAPVSWPISSSSSCAGYIEITDLTGDSRPDVVVGGNCVTLFTNLGNSIFSAGTLLISSFSYPQSNNLAVADFNGDGRNDLVVGGGGLKLLYNNGYGQFTTQELSNTYSESVAVGRLNTDSRPDLSVVGLYGGSCVTYINTGSINNSLAAVNGANPSGTAGLNNYLADVDGDQLDDFLSPYGTNTIYLRRGIGNGQFGSLEQIPYPKNGSTSFRRLTAIDFDNDGNLDLVASGDDAILIYRNLGNAAFAAPVSISMAGPVIDLANGDVDGNGKPDLVVLINPSTSLGEIAVLFNQTALSTRQPTALSRVALYPNPAAGTVNAELPNATFPVQIKLVNTLGQTIAIHLLQSSSQSFSVSTLAPGMYRALITDARYHQTVRALQVK
ncbi:T9SS type A sorting domain-containing protein [Hymenobacter sp.]|jgi:hypothetical protein|uniref:T9SS type A sorting domain-containing protein n=1 Tax=Hymenobacter sp. TaxID=1898978 RepID=UPI002ED83844